MPTEQPFRRRPGGELLPYDRGFHLAVLQGYLTAREASLRGSRKSLARRIAKRHEIPLVLAFMVADNRLSVAEARVRARDHRASNPGLVLAGRARDRSRSVYLWMALGVAIGLAVATIWVRLGRQLPPPPLARPAASRPVARADLPRTVRVAPPVARSTDGLGRLTRVVASDPRGVLLAVCDAAPIGDPMWPVGVGPTVPPVVGARLGILWRPNDWDASRRAIRIRRDARTGRWVAGDGVNPIHLERAPDYPDGVGLLPVRMGGAEPPG